MKNVKSVLATSTSFLCLVVMPASADLVPLVHIEEVAAYVQPASADELLFCTGGIGGAYFRHMAAVAGFVEAYATQPNFAAPIADASPMPGGGTYGCLQKLASGEVDVAAIQMDGRALLKQIGPALMAELDSTGAFLTEEVLTFCSRSNDIENFGELESSSVTVAVAGGAVSGTNVMLNNLTSFDSDFGLPAYVYMENKNNDPKFDALDAALDEVASGDADCAVAVMDINSAAVAIADAKYGNQVRLVGTWDQQFRGLQFKDEQVYGWRAIPENTPGVQHFLDWDGDNGHGTWAPEVATLSAIVVYREGLQTELVDLIKAAVLDAADLKDDVQQ